MPEDRMLVEELVEIYGSDRSSLLAILQGIVKKEHHLSGYNLSQVASKVNSPVVLVYGTEMFYFFMTDKMGRPVFCL